MNLGELVTLTPKLLPLAQRIQKAIATIERIENDPDVKDALALAEEVAAIVAKAEQQ